MKKNLKISLIVLAILFGLVKLTEWYLEQKFDSLINSNPTRAYDITYDSFDLHTFFDGITLDKVKITPINVKKGTVLNGTVDFAKLNGFVLYKFLLSKSLSIDELLFVEPVFKVNVQSDSIKKTKGQTFQNLFDDILSRADLNQFQIKSGSIVVKEHDSILIGQIHSLNLLASEIETDSLILTDIIPFKMGSLEITIDSAFYQLNNYTKANFGHLKYSMAEKELLLKRMALEYDKDWVAISEDRGIQDDVIEFELQKLRISGMNLSSSFWTNLDIEAHKMEIDGLTLSLNRNKNLPRPPKVKKTMFKGMVDKIPYKIDLDSINISNTNIIYGELSANKHTTGYINLNDINGSITKFSTFPERKKAFGSFEAQLKARINNAADLNISFSIPYNKDAFKLHTTVGQMDMTAFSESLVPLLGVEINDGKLKHMEYYMNAGFYQSQNRLVMDYEDLYLTVISEENDGSQHKNGFISSIANVAIRHNNLPEERGYQTASYKSKRNIYRSPFQYIVAGILEGQKLIVPAKGLQSILKTKKKKKKRNKKR
jgi:hypothetical protein